MPIESVLYVCTSRAPPIECDPRKAAYEPECSDASDSRGCALRRGVICGQRTFHGPACAESDQVAGEHRSGEAPEMNGTDLIHEPIVAVSVVRVKSVNLTACAGLR